MNLDKLKKLNTVKVPRYIDFLGDDIALESTVKGTLRKDQN